jgi:hypothetical protein
LDYFFVSNDKVRRYFEPPPGTDLDGREVIQRKGALKDGTPFFLGPDMRPVEPLCSFAFELAKSHKAKTLADYTYGLVDLVEFLAQLDPPTDLLSATEDDLVAYREDRTQRQERPIGPATWQQRRAVINSFYDWAVEEGRLDERPYYRRKSGRDVLAWGATMDLDIRHLTYRQWRFPQAGRAARAASWRRGRPVVSRVGAAAQRCRRRAGRDDGDAATGVRLAAGPRGRAASP